MASRRYVMNTRTGVLHKVPPRADCHLERVPKKQREYFSSLLAGTVTCERKCWHCFPFIRFEGP